jgi:hypothetical protein
MGESCGLHAGNKELDLMSTLGKSKGGTSNPHPDTSFHCVRFLLFVLVGNLPGLLGGLYEFRTKMRSAFSTLSASTVTLRNNKSLFPAIKLTC